MKKNNFDGVMQSKLTMLYNKLENPSIISTGIIKC